MLKSLALLFPPIRRLYEHRNMLAVQREALEERIRAYEAQSIIQNEAGFDAIKQQLDELKCELRKTADRHSWPSSGFHGDAILKAGFVKELTACHFLATRCLFLVGFARSNTTIALNILNTAPNALILGEANFFLPKDECRFSESYNTQHVDFRNQPTKSAYAPDFIPQVNHTWWEWLSSAVEHYEIVGDKMALSSYHLGEMDGKEIKKFFESHFFSAKYIFLIRNPVDTLVSLSKHAKLETDQEIARECDAWLQYIQIWTEWIRNFPQTLTLIVDDFTPETVTKMANFSGLSLDGADSLLNDGNKRKHSIPAHFPTLSAVREDLMEIYNLVKAALADEQVLWQAEQKLSVEENDNRGDELTRAAIVPRSLGNTWTHAQKLRERLDLLKKE